MSAASPVPTFAPPRPHWVLREPADPRIVAELANELRLPAALCSVLAGRGYGDVNEAKAFLKPNAGQIHSATALAGMDAAVDRLQTALGRGETILVHGDYDVDGVCATALLVRALGMMGGHAIPFVPNRITDGYDLTEAGVAAARRVGATLIITADCGIVAHDAVRRAAELGIDVIVTDHHTPGPLLPSALAVINPNRRDCTYPAKGLAGAGVAFKLASALAEAVGFPAERLSAFLDLVAVATIADLAPLTAENRALVRWGLAVLRRTPNAGLRALLTKTGLSDREEITAGHVGFVLAPRINAAGRMADAMRAVRLLLTNDVGEAAELAEYLERQNGLRRKVELETVSDALRIIERAYDPDRDRGIVLASDRWHPGVIGIVASRIVERIHRPTMLISVSGGMGKGSGRSIPGFHLQQALAACSEHLLRFGGHRAAAGCTLEARNIEAFREAFDVHARAVISPDRLAPELRLDGELLLSDATGDLARFLRRLGPFGIANATPLFAAYGVSVVGSPRVVGTDHLVLTLEQDGAQLDAIGFGMADRLPDFPSGEHRLDVAFHLEQNDRRMRREPPGPVPIQARLVDLRPAQ